MILRLVRHASTRWTERGRYCGSTDIGLSPAGQAEADRLGLPGVAYASVVSSDLRRCVETAERAGLAPRVEPALRELDFGDLEGRTWDDLEPDVRSALIGFDGFTAPGGESVAALGARVDRFVAGLGEGTHLLVTHGGVIRHLLRTAGMERHVGPAAWVDLTISRR